MYQYCAKVIDVIDRDTFKLDIDLGFNIHMNIIARALGIDTPEKFVQHKKGLDQKQLGYICKAYATNLLLNNNIIVETQKPDSFGRTLCNILYYDNDNNLISLEQHYNNLGFNKLNESFSEDGILKYKDLLNKTQEI